MSNEPDKLDKTGERDDKGRFVPGHEGKGGRPKGLSITARRRPSYSKDDLELYRRFTTS